jgi:acetyltransferase-like isoleucine patch superfamily enzyme
MSAEESKMMSLRSMLKVAAFSFSLIIVLPLIALSWLEKALSKSESVFSTFAQLVAMVPGPVGTYLRAAYYYGVLDECSWETHFGFGSIFTHRGAHVAARVSTGAYCIIGHANIDSGVRLASRVSIPSGKRQHLDDSGQMSSGTRYDVVALGRDCWVGEGAIIMADVGAGAIVSAGAVVLTEAPPETIVGGNPAKVVKSLNAPNSIQERS